ncbi:MAG: NAD-dependent epimerase/dehydratase family protein [Proteobacteria bacterium]|nr:NAD-dependent epimerase/dehydratase family protein [Pseudomonadota bacterium]
MKALVTGGGGFLGSAIVKTLLDRGDVVKTIQRGDYPFLKEWGIEAIQGDLTRPDDINAAVKDCDVVFHVAAKAGVWGDYDDYYQANVVATKNVIDACKKNNIHYLVYTSTPSVVFDGNDEDGINESAPYAKKYFNAYQETKVEAEQFVINTNNTDLKTVSLRPHLIWGPGDPHLAPGIISRAKTGRLKLVGNKNNKIDSCYIDNAVQAHLLAAECLQSNGVCAGKVYFISNDEPITMLDLINRILATAKLPRVNKTVPENVAYRVGFILEKVYTLLNIKNEPIMTRFIARQLSTSHWFDLTAAKQDLGYQPLVSLDEGMKCLEESLALELIK